MADKFTGVVDRRDDPRNGFWIRRDDGEPEIFSLIAGGGGGRHRRTPTGPKVGDVVEFDVQGSGNLTRAVNVKVITKPKPLKVAWKFSSRDSAAGKQTLVAITLTRDGKVPLGARISLMQDANPVTRPIERPTTDGSGPVYFKTTIPADAEEVEFILAVSEAGKIDEKYVYVWEPEKASHLSVVPEGKGEGMEMFLVATRESKQPNARGIPATVYVISSAPIGLYKHGEPVGEPNEMHEFETDQDGNADIVVTVGEGKTNVNFGLRTDRTVKEGPFVIEGEKPHKLEFDVVKEDGLKWLNLNISARRVKGETSKPLDKFVLTVSSTDGSVLYARLSDDVWQEGKECKFDANKSKVILQLQIKKFAERGTGVDVNLAITDPSGIRRASESSFYVSARYAST